MRKQLSMTEVSALLISYQQQAPLNWVLKTFTAIIPTAPRAEAVVNYKTTETLVWPSSSGYLTQPKQAL